MFESNYYKGLESGSEILQVLLICLDCELIAAIIFDVAAVAGDAGEFEAVLGDQLIERLPQLLIGNRLQLPFLAALPAVAFPARHPLRKSFADVFAVGEELDIAGPL